MYLLHKIKNKYAMKLKENFQLTLMTFNKWDQDNWISTLKKKKKKNLDPYLTLQRLTQSRLYTDLNIRAKTIRLKTQE